MKYLEPGQVFRLPVSGKLFLCLEREVYDEEQGTFDRLLLGWRLVPVNEQPECCMEDCPHVRVGFFEGQEYHPSGYHFVVSHCTSGVQVYAPFKNDLTDKQWRAASLYQAVSAAEWALRSGGITGNAVPGQFRFRWLFLSLRQRLARFVRSIRSRFRPIYIH